MELAETLTARADPVVRVPLTPRAGHPKYTPRFLLAKVGPVDLHAGDWVRTTIAGQFDNENSDAGARWEESVLDNVFLAWEGTRPRLDKRRRMLDVDPRWSLWVGWNVGAWRSPGVPVSPWTGPAGTPVVRERGANVDNWRHHEPWCFSEGNTISAAAPGSYIYSAVWFDTTPEYRLDGAYMEIMRQTLDVEIFRQV